MATNNAINLKSSGIVSYDGAGTFTALANPLPVVNGGTEVSSLTAYAVICGGTTTTSPLQSIASVGTSGQSLTSNGTSALPTFQTTVKSGFFFNLSTLSGTPADATTYFLQNTVSLSSISATGNSGTRFYIPTACTLTKAYGVFSCTAGTNQNVTIRVTINNTTNADITTTLQMNVASGTFNNTSLSSSLSAGDYIECKMVCPTWTTNPTAVRLTLALYFSG